MEKHWSGLHSPYALASYIHILQALVEAFEVFEEVSDSSNSVMNILHGQ